MYSHTHVYSNHRAGVGWVRSRMALLVVEIPLGNPPLPKPSTCTLVPCPLPRSSGHTHQPATERANAWDRLQDLAQPGSRHSPLCLTGARDLLIVKYVDCHLCVQIHNFLIYR